MGIISFLNSWQFVLLFYIGAFVLIYLNRDKFDIQAKFIALYRTKYGLKLMDRIAKKHTKLVKVLGYIGIVVGYIGMALITYLLLDGIYNLLYVPEAPPTISPVLPGVKVPGSPIHLPFWYGIISLFIVVVIHEFSHGVVARAHKIKVKNSGLVAFGPLPGAFVEPDEDQMKKAPKKVQNSIMAAGPWSNIITAGIILALFAFVMTPVMDATFEPNGVTFPTVEEGFPAEAAGVQSDTLYTMVNGERITDQEAFIEYLGDPDPGEVVTLGNDMATYEITAAEHPQNASRGYVGITIQTSFANADSVGYRLFSMFAELLSWIFILSIGLGLANLLPIGPVDGGRMFHIACVHFLGEKKGVKIWSNWSILLLVIIFFLLVVPIVRALI